MTSKFLSMLCFLALLVVSCSKKTEVIIQPNPTVVNIITDIEYGSNVTWLNRNQVLTLDLYSPGMASAKNKYRLLVLVHGGSFLTGDKDSLADLCHALAEKGMIVASINYRLGWNATGSTNCKADTASLNEAAYRAMQDLNASLRFLTASADQYFIDTNWIFTGGASAGAVAALNAAYLTDAYAGVRFSKAFNKLGGLSNADNMLTNTYTIKGICSMWGGIFDAKIITASNAIPAIFYHGSNDATIPVNAGTYLQCPNYPVLYGSEFLYDKLNSLKVPAVAHIYEGGEHAPSAYKDNAAFTATNTYCFFEGLRDKTPQSGLYKQMESSCR